MEFNEKLQQLRKDKGLTQEELAEALFVSRTAVSKWESGRGYPNIESLKDISVFFSVSIDDLLSGEKLLSIAEKENKSNIRNVCDLLFAVTDLFSLLLVILPLYPNVIDGYVYSVNLMNYNGNSPWIKAIYWLLIILLFLMGVVKMVLLKLNYGKVQKLFTDISAALNIMAVIFLAVSRQSYAVIAVFLLLTAKGIILIKRIKADD